MPCGSASLSVSNARKALYRLQSFLIGHTTGSSPFIKLSGYDFPVQCVMSWFTFYPLLLFLLMKFVLFITVMLFGF